MGSEMCIRDREDAEKEPQLAQALRHCRSNPELVLAARRLGYRVTRVDLEQARLADKKEHEQQNLAAHLSN